MSVRRLVLAAPAGLVLGLLVAPAAAAAPAPDYELPFVCGEAWTGTTRPTHSPSRHAVDFNRPEDLGRPVVASAPGVVTVVKDLKSTSYGRYVVIDHGAGETSLYAHLQTTWLVVGQRVDQGQQVGTVGESGNVSGPHLHFEERIDGADHAAWFHGAAYEYGTSRSLNCGDSPVAGDWNGDGKDDVGIHRRTARGARIFQRIPGTTSPLLIVGPATAEPVVGDWDGDGRDDVGARIPARYEFRLRQPDGTFLTSRAGIRGDRAVTGDWDGDGRTDLGLWRPSTATFALLRPGQATTRVPLGAVGSLPVTGDWNGDRRTDLGVFDQATATFTLRMVGKDGTVWSATVRYGAPGDLPVTGDWDGDKVTDLGVWSPRTAVFSLRTADPGGGTARVTSLTYGRGRTS